MSWLLAWIIYECEVSSWAERPRIPDPPPLRVGRARSRRTPIAARNHSVAEWRSNRDGWQLKGSLDSSLRSSLGMTP